MSIQSVPFVDSPTEGVRGLMALVVAGVRAPAGTAINGPNIDYTFTPDLTPAEVTAFGDCLTIARFGIASTITLAEFQAIKSDLATAKAFLGIASPTNAQAVAAEKSIIRILGALLRA